MVDALVGVSGFIGTTLLRQRAFGATYRSTNIDEIERRDFDLVVCAGAPGQKWRANQEPAADFAALEKLMRALATITCRKFVLVSTVDVFKNPVHVDERSEPDEVGLKPYGRHRLSLERFVRDRFADHLIVRLPGLVGPGLRKNVIFDLHNKHRLDSIDGRGVFQFYPTVNLWVDIEISLHISVPIIHLTVEPLSVSEIASQIFGVSLCSQETVEPAHYDVATIFAKHFGVEGKYQYRRADAFLAIQTYAQSEPNVVY